VAPAIDAASAPDAAIAKPDGPSVELVVTIGKALHWYTVSLAGVQKTRTVPLPSAIHTIVWLGREPAFELEDKRVAIVTQKGLEYIPLPPASTFARPDPGNSSHVDPPSTRLFAKDGALWLGKCEWSGSMYGCDFWVNARIRPGPVVTNRETYNDVAMTVDVPTPSPPIKPSSKIQVALVPDPDRPPVEPGTKRMKLRCTANGKTIEDPPPGEKAVEPQMDSPPYAPGRGDLTWLSTEPPIFEVGTDACAPCPRMVIYEGCVPSTRFDSVEILPSELMALAKYDDKISFRKLTFVWRGRELGTLDRVDQLAAVPTK
jgi:hypothetical protein